MASKRSRIAAFIALLGIAWGALWPLIATARPKAPAIPHFICTQGEPKVVWVDPAPAPVPSAHGEHCPWCIFPHVAALPHPAFFHRAPDLPPSPPPPRELGALPEPRSCVKLPPSRAPPMGPMPA